jgi:hypothetical protein
VPQTRTNTDSYSRVRVKSGGQAARPAAIRGPACRICPVCGQMWRSGTRRAGTTSALSDAPHTQLTSERAQTGAQISVLHRTSALISGLTFIGAHPADLVKASNIHNELWCLSRVGIYNESRCLSRG